jgi:hypothetical protein
MDATPRKWSDLTREAAFAGIQLARAGFIQLRRDELRGE